jgi:cobalt-zinc-cadmium efflux system outer membrane protein
MRTIDTNLFLIAATSLLTGISLHAQQMPDMPQIHDQSQHEHMQMSGVTATYPQMGRAQQNAQGKLFTLEDAQKLASESNPTLRQAESEIRAAKARQLQSGLYPNPTIGYTGDEIRGGSTAGGKQGFFAQQTIVTGGKLANNRQVFSKETQIAQLEVEEQKVRVQTAIRTAFLRVLAAQELLDARRDLAKIEQDYAGTERLLGNTGQADETEILQAEISARRQKLGTHMQENALLEEWRALVAVIGKPDLPLLVVSGDLQTGWP